MVPNRSKWEYKLFKRVLKLDRGSSPRPIINFMTNAIDGVNWIKIGDTQKGELYINSTKEKITPEGAKKSRKVSKGEIIVSNSMSYGQPYILNIDGYIHDGWFVIRNYEKNFAKNYLLQLLGSELIQRQYKRLAAGGVVSNISSDLVYAVKALIPPLPEQRKIAKILATWDKAIVTTEKLIGTSRQQKKALMQQLLTGKKRLLDPGTGVPFSDKWEEVRLSKICSRLTEKNKGQSENVVTISAQHGLIRQEEFFKKSVASAILDDYFILKKGQFAYNKSYSNGYPMGAIKRLNRYENAVVTSLYICFEIENIATTSSDFMEQYFESGLLNKELTKVAAEGGRAHGLLNVKPSDFMALLVTVPSLPEQQKIAQVLFSADKEIEILEAKLAHLKQEKKALMQQLLTGKRRVQVEVS